MSKTRVAGFTIIEILIVIVIITIMVGAGGFYYRDLQRQIISRKAFEDAANLANIINDIYNTGHFGTSSDSLAGLNVKKGTYPDVNKAILIKERLAKAYGGQFKKQNILIADSAKFHIKPGVSPMLHNVLDGQTPARSFTRRLKLRFCLAKNQRCALAFMRQAGWLPITNMLVIWRLFTLWLIMLANINYDQ